jgi:hypothetical protein
MLRKKIIINSSLFYGFLNPHSLLTLLEVQQVFFCLFERVSNAKKVSDSGVETHFVRQLAYRQREGKPAQSILVV